MPKLELVFASGLEAGGNIAVEMDRFDHAIGEHARGDAFKLLAPKLAVNEIRAPRADFSHAQADIADRRLGRGGDGIHHAGLEVNLDPADVAVVRVDRAGDLR